jgi:putative transposase
MLMTSLSNKDELIGHIDSSSIEANAYFLTICTYARQQTLGQIENGQMTLNARGKSVEEEWFRTAESFENVNVDAFVVMPNHFHGIFWLTAGVPPSTSDDSSPHPPDGELEAANSAEEVIQSFKAAVTDRAKQLFDAPIAPFWQPSFHAHPVRQKKALPALRKYIQDNPADWSRDDLNPIVGDPSCAITPPPILD